MKKVLIISIIIVAVAVLLLFVTSNTGLFTLGTQNNTIKIGVLGSMTGIGSYFGQQEIRGVETAVEQINANGGINGKQVKLIIEDTETDPNKASLAIDKLSNVDNIHFIVGDSWNNTTLAILPKTNEDKIVMISGVATLDALSKDDFFFRTVPNTKGMMVLLADYVYEQGSRKLGILCAATPFGDEHAKDFMAEFEKLGGKLVATEKFELSATDVRVQINKVKNANPDTIFDLHGSGPMFGTLLKQAKELDVNVRWLGSYSAENSVLLKDYRDVADNIYYPYYYEIDLNNSFTKRYLEKYGELPESTAANSYDALMILSKAISAVGEDPVKVKQYLLTMPVYHGASGDILFDANGDGIRNYTLRIVKDGKIVLYK